jgi:tRNA pseudouridine32 synthase / 23S rRNA pseudouridine746 synthase
VTGGAGIPVLLEDAHLVVVCKPAGRLVIPGRRRDEPSLVEELAEGLGRLWVVHRLDRGTSGVLVFARTAAAHRALNLAFDRGEPRKRYLALVRGEAPAELRVEAAIAPGRKGRMRAAAPGDPRGKPSATAFRRLEAFPARTWSAGPLALVEALPETGRTHQIRVHLAEAGYPLAVDPDYGDPGPLVGPGGRILLGRTPLHAERLELAHPASGAPLTLRAPLAPDLEEALAVLRASP